jgi:hypothetical protein
MSKRLTLSDYIYTLVFIFLLVCIVAAFFYGHKVGKEQTLEQYADLINPPVVTEQKLAAYHQQYLVSFYHTIYLPYRDYQKKWFEHMNSIELRSNTTDTKSVFKELEKTANEKYLEMLKSTVPDSSPLLFDAHRHYLKSIKLFQNAAKDFKDTDKQGGALILAIQDDAYFQEAQNFALQAQDQYFNAIVKWHESIDPKLEGSKMLSLDNLPLDKWQSLELNVKNGLVAKEMYEHSYYKPYLPQDITIRIDEMMALGQDKNMNLSSLNEIIEMLVNTGAVRQGDYNRARDRYYKDEVLPQLPFFFE